MIEGEPCEVYISVTVDGVGNWVAARVLPRPDHLVQLDDGTVGVWPNERIRVTDKTEDERNARLANYIRAYQTLSEMPAKQLVDLALEYLEGYSQLEWLLVEELCSRVQPGWEKQKE